MSVETLRICQLFSKRRCHAKTFVYFVTTADAMRSGIVKMLAHLQSCTDAVVSTERGFEAKEGVFLFTVTF